MTPKEQFDLKFETFYQESHILYTQAIRDVLNANPHLDYYIDAMGAQFFVTKSGENVGSGDDRHEEMTADMLEFLDGFASEHYDCFRSVGFQVHRDKIVTDW